MQSYSMTHCLPSSLRKRYARKLKNSFTKEKAQDHMLFSEQIRNMDYKIYPDKKQDHLGKYTTLWITGFQAYPSQQFNNRMDKDNIQFAKLIEQFESHQHKEQFLKVMSQT